MPEATTAAEPGAQPTRASEVMQKTDAAARMLGMVIERNEPGDAVVSMVLRDDMMNGFAITHGGLVFTLADTAFAYACNEDEHVTVAQGAEISFLASSKAGQTLTAHARRVVRSGRNGIYDVTVTSDDGTRIAEFRGRSFATSKTV